MMGARRSDLEIMLASAIGAYFRACDHANREEQREQACTIGSTLARLLGNRLESSEHWNRYRWVDDLIWRTLAVPSPGVLEVRGLMVWGEDGRCEWVEPFFARVQLPAAGGSIQGYTLCFGAPNGLAGTAYGSQSVLKLSERASGNDWLIVFCKGCGGDKTMRRGGEGARGR